MKKNKKENELNKVTLSQAKKLKALDFDWPVSDAFLKLSSEKKYSPISRVGGFNFNGMDHYYDDIDKDGMADAVSAPPVVLALKFIRKKFGIFHYMSTRSWSDKQPFAWSIGHSLLPVELPWCDLSDGADDKNDGAIFDYEEAESKAVEYALNYLMQNIDRDFSWLKRGAKAYKPTHYTGANPKFEEYKVLEINKKLKTAKIQPIPENKPYWVYFRILYSTPQEAEAAIASEVETWS